MPMPMPTAMDSPSSAVLAFAAVQSYIKGEVHPKIKFSQFVDFEALISVVKVPSPCDTPFWRYLNLKFTMTSCKMTSCGRGTPPPHPVTSKRYRFPVCLLFSERERVAFVEFLSCDLNNFNHDDGLLCCRLL